MNLAVNAQDAMPGGGRLVLATENLSVSLEEARQDPAVPQGDYAQLTVRDTGIGMDESVRDRVFEPFFTTKPPPEGTGLGLSMVYGIIRQSHGFISVDSTLGEGTTFRILLPKAEPIPPETEPGRSGELSEGCRVLVVESDDGVRWSTSRALEGLGYTVASAASAEEALATLEGATRTPDLLVAALSLPGMNGRELADRFQSNDPGRGVLFLSGYAVEGDDDLDDMQSGRGLIRKPYSLGSLTAAVRRLLAES